MQTSRSFRENDKLIIDYTVGFLPRQPSHRVAWTEQSADPLQSRRNVAGNYGGSCRAIVRIEHRPIMAVSRKRANTAAKLACQRDGERRQRQGPRRVLGKLHKKNISTAQLFNSNFPPRPDKESPLFAVITRDDNIREMVISNSARTFIFTYFARRETIDPEFSSRDFSLSLSLCFICEIAAGISSVLPFRSLNNASHSTVPMKFNA